MREIGILLLLISASKKYSLEVSFRAACSGMEAFPQYLDRLQNIMDSVYDESYWEDGKGMHGQWTAVSHAQELASIRAAEEKKLRQEGESRGLLPGEKYLSETGEWGAAPAAGRAG